MRTCCHVMMEVTYFQNIVAVTKWPTHDLALLSGDIFIVLFGKKILNLLLQGVWRFCMEQPTSSRHLSRCEKDGGRGRQNGLHAFPRWTQLMWHSKLIPSFSLDVQR